MKNKYICDLEFGEALFLSIFLLIIQVVVLFVVPEWFGL